MNAIRPYLPLIGFMVPTAVVGYGVVIPQSCIAGVNELTIGYGTTLLGVVFTYVAGQRAVMPPGACKKPLSAHLTQAINRQAAAPRGAFGRLLAVIWGREHARLNAEVLDQLDVRPGQRVLEIGSGPGHALAEAARRVRGGQVVGIDVSALMARLARDRNRDAVARGKVELRVADVGSLCLEAAAFDRIFSVHSLYFWRDVDAVLGKLAAALRPGGKLVLAFRPEGEGIPARFRDATYAFPRVEALRATLERLGLAVESLSPSAAAPNVVLLTATRGEEAAVVGTPLAPQNE